MRARTVNEMQTEIGRSFPLAEVSWSDVNPDNEGRINVKRDAGSYTQVDTPTGFEYWKDKFIEEYGDEGDLVEVITVFTPTTKRAIWEVKGNPQYDAYKTGTAKGYSDYYASKGSGGFTGD